VDLSAAMPFRIAPPALSIGSIFAALTLGTPATADPYAALNRLEGAALKRAASGLAARGHKPLGYRELWEVLKEADRHPSRPGHVIGVYSRAAIPTPCAEGKARSGCEQTWNREHVWPKSKVFPRRDQWAHTDAHHIAAESVRCNSLRGNRDLGVGGKLHLECASRRGTGAAATWEPSDAAKGQVARMLMYVAVRYEGDPLGDQTPNLELVSRATRDGEPQLGDLCVLLRWHQAFPVTAQERDRHAVVVRFQGNRNPFVDQPDLALRIWGRECGVR
jgi:endonuclease I